MPFEIIALDGPAGSGKSTVARVLAEKLGYVHADSGAMYRTVTLALMEKLGTAASAAEFGQSLASSPVDFSSLGCSVILANGAQSNRIDGTDVGDRIRTPEVTARIRYIADNRTYREAVNELLRNFAEQTNLAADGRDIGTIVFPDANYKFYLEASVQVRARRRLLEYESRGIDNIVLEELEKEIRKRDDQDRSRPFGALKQAPDAILIDTSDLNINGVVSRLLSCMQIEL